MGTWLKSSQSYAAKVGIAAIKVHHFLHLALEASRPVQLVSWVWVAFSEGGAVWGSFEFTWHNVSSNMDGNDSKLMLFVFQVVLILYGLYDKVKLSVDKVTLKVLNVVHTGSGNLHYRRYSFFGTRDM